MDIVFRGIFIFFVLYLLMRSSDAASCRRSSRST
jgi:hypothetical protein